MNRQQWISRLKPFIGGVSIKSTLQLILTFLLYFTLLGLMVYLVLFDFPYWIVLLLALPAGGLHVKIFIIMHDCGHNSYFNSKKISTWVGRICGLTTHTPYYDWTHAHAIHHGSVANLEKRGTGDIWTLTSDEYIKAHPLKKIIYRIYRNPIFLFGAAPSFFFLIISRFPHKNMTKKDLASILMTDLMLALIIAGISLTIGIGTYLKVLLPIAVLANISGVWLFYVQHQFKEVYWSDSDNWDSIHAAMKGSSFYKLPGILRWFSGNIGYHHIHHLNSQIPNYNLKKCYESIPELQDIIPLTIIPSLKTLFLGLWDEKTATLISFRKFRKQAR